MYVCTEYRKHFLLASAVPTPHARNLSSLRDIDLNIDVTNTILDWSICPESLDKKAAWKFTLCKLRCYYPFVKGNFHSSKCGTFQCDLCRTICIELYRIVSCTGMAKTVYVITDFATF